MYLRFPFALWHVFMESNKHVFIHCQALIIPRASSVKYTRERADRMISRSDNLHPRGDLIVRTIIQALGPFFFLILDAPGLEKVTHYLQGE
ncbi:hypothetical protein DUNSADRAFT_11722 [Dunaliella salina]|uniref:Encoded protein n=1 Tax=Dunaliella salina TaxID=3046 RepID=A0ABQ7GCT8_DUNSA|nr:hypothetical protein DUNSADRAFT_11722 [Dunaliella salina]|eukprot:KAF5832390.1 hypothetical protein DUNSADRAFT_11722 [Dunaliella salina]